MTNHDLAAYLTAAAWADGPITDSERCLVENLLFNLGLERGEANDLLDNWEFKAPSPPSLQSLSDRSQAVALLRALLVVSYSDGHFGMEELPYLTKILDRFKVSTEEMRQLRLQAQYYLDPSSDPVAVPEDLIAGQRWDELAEFARQHQARLRQLQEAKIRQELQAAQRDSLLVMLYRGRSFDIAEAAAEFAKRQEDLRERHGPLPDNELLQAQLTLMTLAKWDRLYAERCSNCQLAAPGRKGDPCPRCQEDYR